MTRTARIANVTVGAGQPLALIAGPCIIESHEATLNLAVGIRKVADELGVPVIFKASFDKANRSSIDSYRGPGLERGLKVLADVKRETGLPVTTDIHEPGQAASVAEIVDLIQIPAFLCRQTDLLVAAAVTGKPVNVKKGQFLAPWDMANVVAKLRQSGCSQILLTERGAAFGYNALVSDMRSIPLMQRLGCPVVFDATHSVQQPGSRGTRTGGDRQMIAPLALAAVAAGCDALFLETHEEPDKALSDAAVMLPFADLRALLQKAVAVRGAI
jgi:2-dehydro-3-deoxyphosphooctonate aldolase (KDO 8-P synthase)